jgi:hypothetical protein
MDDTPDVFWEAVYEIVLFENYLTTLGSFIESQAKPHRESLEELRASGQITHADDGPPPEEDYDRYHLDLLDQFTNISRRSFFLSLYAYLESQLINECRKRKREDCPLSFSDIKGPNEIDKAKTYFTKVLRVSFPSDTPERQEIQDYRRLCNCITHNQGRLDDGLDSQDQKPLREYIARKKNLSLHGDEIYLDDGFCEEACRTIGKFLRLLLVGNRSTAR